MKASVVSDSTPVWRPPLYLTRHLYEGLCPVCYTISATLHYSICNSAICNRPIPANCLLFWPTAFIQLGNNFCRLLCELNNSANCTRVGAIVRETTLPTANSNGRLLTANCKFFWLTANWNNCKFYLHSFRGNYRVPCGGTKYGRSISVGWIWIRKINNKFVFSAIQNSSALLIILSKICC